MTRRNKLTITIFFIFIIGLLTVFILNLNVSYNQGINYEYKILKIPLYLKIIDFYSRHFHYKILTKEIIAGAKSDKDKVFRLFNWTDANIRPVPEGFPIVDNHVWDIIVRGYGTDDQLSDVFTTLCNYAKIEAFFTWVKPNMQKRKIPFSFVMIDRRWYVFDPYRGIYFTDNKGNLADIQTTKSGSYIIKWLSKINKEIDYSIYVGNFPDLKNVGLTRANTQFPLNRLLLEIKKLKEKFLSKKY